MKSSTLIMIAHQHGTPVYIYDGGAIRSTVQTLTDALQGEVEVYYSIKANPALAVCSLIRQSGVDGAEIASSGELEAAIASGYDPYSLLFAGPGKTDEELRLAIAAGVGQINAESIHEIRRIQSIAQELSKKQRVGVRVNLDTDSSNPARISTSGAGQKFGINESQTISAIREIEESSHLSFTGIHTMLGSQILNTHTLVRNCKSTISMVTRIAQELRLPIPSINFGGGLGVPHTEDDDQFDISDFGRELVQLVNEIKANQLFRDCRFMIEPGRILVSKHGIYLAKVIDVKESDNSNIAILDGGINHALLPITANQYQVEVINRKPTESTTPITIGGPLCTSADQWRSQVQLSDVQIGDLIAMQNAGAYGLTASMTKFLSRETPAEVLVLDGRVHLIREPSKPADVLRGQSVPSELQED